MNNTMPSMSSENVRTCEVHVAKLTCGMLVPTTKNTDHVINVANDFINDYHR